MEPIELYDIITLKNDEEYAVLKILEHNNKKYFLLAPVDEDEEPDMEKIKIVEELEENGQFSIAEIENEDELKEVSKLLLSWLKEVVE